MLLPELTKSALSRMQPTFVCYPFILITAEELSGFQSIPSTGNNK